MTVAWGIEPLLRDIFSWWESWDYLVQPKLPAESSASCGAIDLDADTAPAIRQEGHTDTTDSAPRSPAVPIHQCLRLMLSMLLRTADARKVTIRERLLLVVLLSGYDSWERL